MLLFLIRRNGLHQCLLVLMFEFANYLSSDDYQRTSYVSQNHSHAQCLSSNEIGNKCDVDPTVFNYLILEMNIFDSPDQSFKFCLLNLSFPFRTSNKFKLIYLFYSLLSFLKTSIHYIHLVYYVQTYISIYQINSYSFWLAESVFLLWNCFNDLLFGWWSDRYISSISNRLDYLTKCGFLFSLSSLLFWYPLVERNSSLLGLQLVISLCLYDSFLTMIDLNYSSLLIEIGQQHKREFLSSASAIGNAFGKNQLNLFVRLLENLILLKVRYHC